jgi:hypothetical protein
MRALILTALMGALAAPASTVNFSGKWTMEISDRPGRTIQATLILTQVGSEVSGSVVVRARASSGSPAGTEIYGGKVEGDVITFYVWTGDDTPVKVLYRGTLSDDEIHFTVTGSPVRFDVRGKRIESPGPQEVTARRTK